MTAKLRDVEEIARRVEERRSDSDRILAARGVRIPAKRGPITFRPSPKRPKWLAFVVRLFT